jgi:inorganic pyrophosphatase
MPEPPIVDVVIEIARGSFLKRGSTGHIDFISPLPCPYNYGSVPTHIGLEGDLLDAIVLGPRLPLGTELRTKVWGAVTFTDRGMSDDKLICSDRAPTLSQCRNLLRFFRLYAPLQGTAQRLARTPGAQCVRRVVQRGGGAAPRATAGPYMVRLAGGVLIDRLLILLVLLEEGP